MDDYIKRKKKSLEQPLNTTPIIENQSEIVARQIKNEVSSLSVKLKYIDERSIELKKKLQQIQFKSQIVIDNINKPILGNTPMQKSSIATQILNREASKPNNNIQQNNKLGVTSAMVNKISCDSNERGHVNKINEKLQQSSQINVRKRIPKRKL